MKKWLFICILTLPFVVLVTGCDSSPKKELVENAPFISQTYTDDLDRQVTLNETPKTVVSLAPGITETLYAIGAEDLLIARSDACNYPEWVEDKPGVPLYPLLDRDSALSFHPDLILASDETVSIEESLFFDGFNQPIYFQTYSSYSDIYRNIRTIGEIVGKEQEANHLADSLETIEQSIFEETKDEIKYNTVILISIDPLAVAGGGSFMNEMIAKAGGNNPFSKKYEKYPVVTEEEMVKANVEFIILPTRNSGGSMLSELTGRYPRLAALPAIQLGQVFDNLPKDLILRPGPRSVEGLAMLTRVLHVGIDTGKYFEEPEAEEEDDWGDLEE